jgi:ABC-type uncharacterized transport system fused permease/ATPase subunit
MKGDIDNPDQRIAEDAASFTDVSLDFAIKIMSSVIDLINFSGVLYSIYPQVWGLGFRVWGFGLRVEGLGFRVEGVGLWVISSVIDLINFSGVLYYIYPQV